MKIEEHDELIHKDIFPRLKHVEQQQHEYNQQLLELKQNLANVTLSTTDLKNTVIGQGNDQKVLLNRLLDHVLVVDKDAKDIKGKVTLAKTKADKEIAIKRLSTKEAILVALFSGGAVAALPSLFDFIQNLINK